VSTICLVISLDPVDINKVTTGVIEEFSKVRELCKVHFIMFSILKQFFFQGDRVSMYCPGWP
jgi:hypothetical protein